MAAPRPTWEKTRFDNLSHYPLREMAQRGDRLENSRTPDSKDDYKPLGSLAYRAPPGFRQADARSQDVEEQAVLGWRTHRLLCVRPWACQKAAGSGRRRGAVSAPARTNRQVGWPAKLSLTAAPQCDVIAAPCRVIFAIIRTFPYERIAQLE